jgi:hypothetical protein
VVTHVETKSKVRRRLAGAVVGAILAASLMACGERQSALDQTHIGGERFTRVKWEDLPRPSNSTKKSYVGTKFTKTMVLEVPDTSTDNTLAWYDQQLTSAGWNKKTGPDKTVDGQLVTYERMGRTLALTVFQAPPAGGTASPVSITMRFNKPLRGKNAIA